MDSEKPPASPKWPSNNLTKSTESHPLCQAGAWRPGRTRGLLEDLAGRKTKRKKFLNGLGGPPCKSHIDFKQIGKLRRKSPHYARRVPGVLAECAGTSGQPSIAPQPRGASEVETQKVPSRILNNLLLITHGLQTDWGPPSGSPPITSGSAPHHAPASAQHPGRARGPTETWLVALQHLEHPN